MSLSDSLQPDTELRPPWQVCTVRWVMDQVEPSDGIALSVALEDKRVPADKIADAVRANLGLPLSGETVRRHRRGYCRCSR